MNAAARDSHSDYVVNYAKLLTVLMPRIRERAVSLIGEPATAGSVEWNLDQDGPEKHAVVIARMLLHAAVDGLETWLAASRSDSATFQVGVQGTAHAVRQVLECAATAAWLVEDTDLLEVRGFAALWYDAKEQKAWDRPRMFINDADASSRLDKLRHEGQQRGLMNEPGTAPVVKMLGKTASCAAIHLDPDSFGTDNAGGFYQWLSGMSHGWPWASLMQRAEPVGTLVRPGPDGLRPTGETLTVPRPNYVMLASSAFAAHVALQTACDRLQRLTRPPGLS